MSLPSLFSSLACLHFHIYYRRNLTDLEGIALSLLTTRMTQLKPPLHLKLEYISLGWASFEVGTGRKRLVHTSQAISEDRIYGGYT